MWLSESSSGVTVVSTSDTIYPVSLTLDTVGNIYIGGIDSIVKWSRTTENFTTIVSGSGSSSDRVSGVIALALTPDNANLFAADIFNNRVQKYLPINNCAGNFSPPPLN
ncbi:unnamed protein product [Rotaria sp. Silwood2]|nr:unnamed protein product [Rotaria sp. Silwood2]CAF4321543.1 unnamed protein product [Rotaria sp. Silwood2]